VLKLAKGADFLKLGKAILRGLFPYYCNSHNVMPISRKTFYLRGFLTPNYL